MKKQIGIFVLILFVSSAFPAVASNCSKDTGPRAMPVKNNGEDTVNIYLWGGLGVNADIRYNGTNSSLDVQWLITVDGGILGLIHQSTGGIVVVQRGESRWVSSGLFLGFGKFTILAKANDMEKTATGVVLFCEVIKITQ